MTGIHLSPDRSAVRRAVTVAALLAASGLALAGCKGSPSASGSSNSSATASATSTAGSGGHGSGASGTSLTADYPVAVGNTWVYQTQASGLSHGTVTSKMTSVAPVSAGQRVRMRVTSNSAGAKMLTATATYLFHSDGSITVPFTQFSTAKVRIISGRIIWPTTAQLKSRQRLHSRLVVEATILGRQLRIAARVVVRGGGTQAVAVPAGSYRAQVVEETVTEKVDGTLATTKVRTWLAPGVGPVKEQELTSAAGSAGTSSVEVLKSFTRG